MWMRVVAAGFATLTVLSSLAAIVILPELDPVSGMIGLAIQLAGVMVVAFLRPPYAAVSLVVVTCAAAWLPTGWQVAHDHQMVVWIPFAAALTSNRLVIQARSRPEVIITAGSVAIWCLITIGNSSWSVTSVLAGTSPVLGGACFALISRLADARRDRLASLQEARLVADRERLLGDLHDLFTHRITHVVLKARQLGDTTVEAPVRAGLGEIEATATDTLAALRDYLVSARSVQSTAEAAGCHSVSVFRSDLGEIIDAERSVGRQVRLSGHADVAGEEHGPMISSAVRACLIRAAREALTNAAKHAAGAPVVVTLATSGRVRLDVLNEPPGTEQDHHLSRSGSGTGLRGLSNRCRLLGGTMAAEPDEHGGFAVTLELPLVGRDLEVTT